MPLPVHGPFNRLRDLTAAARPLEHALAEADPAGALGAAARRARAGIRFRFLLDGLLRAGVSLGSCELAVARDLSTATAETLVVLVDWLARAGAAGHVELLAEAAEHIDPCPPGPDGRCEHGAWGQCSRTDLAYRLRGLDPRQARRHALEKFRERKERG